MGEERLKHLEDQEEIRRLLTEYGARLDDWDARGFAELFAEDGEWFAPPDYRSRGRAAIQAMIERLAATGPAPGQSHILTNFVIDVAGDQANARSCFYVLSASEEGAPRIRLSGRYIDELVRENGRWKFAKRTLSPELRLPSPPAPQSLKEGDVEFKPEPIRRIVTRHDASGRSTIASDGPATLHANIGSSGMTVHDIWELAAIPALLEAEEPDPTDIPLHFAIPETGLRARIVDMQPSKEGAEPFMHRTSAVDLVFVLDGELTMLMEDEKDEIVLRKGDTLVQRGTNHAWVNRSDKPCRVLFVIVAARLSDELRALIGPDEREWDASGGGVR